MNSDQRIEMIKRMRALGQLGRAMDRGQIDPVKITLHSTDGSFTTIDKELLMAIGSIEKTVELAQAEHDIQLVETLIDDFYPYMDGEASDLHQFAHKLGLEVVQEIRRQNL